MFNTTPPPRRSGLKNFLISTKKSLVKSIKEFCKNSTLHGLNYIANKNLCLFERAFFAVSFVTVVIIAGFFINNVYNKWCTTPVLFSINPQPTHIRNEPFPGVTICNMNQAYKSKVMTFEKNSAAYATTQILCKHEVNDTIARGIKDWNFLNSFIANISQPCEKMLLECHYSGIKYSCSHLFRPTITDEGLCCSFNMVHPKFMYKNEKLVENEPSTTQRGKYTDVPWTAETGYPSKLPKHFYPVKAAGIGESLGLEVILDAEADEYYCSSSNSFGFKMVLHSPTDPPCIKEVGLLLAAGYETKARVRIEKLQSDPKLQLVDIKHRQCLFQDEDHLNYFASYSHHNCMMECGANLLMRHCRCVSYFMPRVHGNETVCSIYDLECKEHLKLYLIRSDDDDPDDDDDIDRSIDERCEKLCLPSCSDLKYYADFSTTPLSHVGLGNNILRNLSREYIKRNIALLTVYYQDSSYRSHVQTEFIGMTDVLSSVGGLIGLFFGFSFISLAEIVFYTFVRPFRRYLTELKNKRKGNSKDNVSVLIRSSPAFRRHPYKPKRSAFKHGSVFGRSRNVGTITPTLDADNCLIGQDRMPNLVYNIKLSKDFPQPKHTNEWNIYTE